MKQLLTHVKDKALRAITNARSYKPSRKLVVFESDDWGSIRIPGKTGLSRLEAAGINMDRSKYDRLDCLESRSDLEALFSVLSEHQDGSGKPALFTFNTVMGNPDFDRIKAEQFSEYFWRPFFNAYQDYYDDDLEHVWRTAIRERLIAPQFHAREHLNSDLWMSDLRKGVESAVKAFDLGYFAQTAKTGSHKHDLYLTAHWPESLANLQAIEAALSEGLEAFERTFGYKSQTFIPCCYHFYSQGEAYVNNLGVNLIQGQRVQLEPRRAGLDHSYVVKRRHTGQANECGQLYTARNVMFEPYLDPEKDWVSSAFSQIQSSFFFGAPAIVCTHRVNYVSGLCERNRDRSLRQLDQLLRKITSYWPDVEFMSSSELCGLMLRGRLHLRHSRLGQTG